MNNSVQVDTLRPDAQPRRVRRLLAALAAAALAFGGLVVASTPAQAATTDGVTSVSGSWNVSNRWLNYVMYAPMSAPPYSVNSASSTTPALPSSCTLAASISSLAATQPADCVIPLAGGAGGSATATTASGVSLGSISWVSPHFPGGVTFSQMTFSVDASAKTATVTANVSGDSSAVPTATNDVTIATFDLSSTTPTVSSGVVTYSGLVGTISSTIDTVIPAWSAYKGTASAPLTVAITTAQPTVTAGITASSFANGLSVAVSGDGFRGVTNTGDNGVYVGIAPSGGLPDVSSSAGAAAFAAAAYIPAATLTSGNGAFSTSLTAATASLDPTKSYSVYTWQAHTHSNTTQDTETKLSINWATLKQPDILFAVSAKKTVSGKPVTISATLLPGATGTVEFFDGSTSLGVVTVADAKATLTTSFLVGAHKLTVKYSGDSTYKASTSVDKNITVTKTIPSSAKVTGTTFAKNTKPKLTVTVGKLTNGAYASGTAAIKVNGKTVKTVAINAKNKGVTKQTLPSASAKSVVVKITFTPKKSATNEVAVKSSKSVIVSVKK